MSEGVSDAARKTAAGSRQGRFKRGLSRVKMDLKFMLVDLISPYRPLVWSMICGGSGQSSVSQMARSSSASRTLTCWFARSRLRRRRRMIRVGFRISTFSGFPKGLQVQLGEPFLDRELVAGCHAFNTPSCGHLPEGTSPHSTRCSRRIRSISAMPSGCWFVQWRLGMMSSLFAPSMWLLQ